MTIRNLNYQLQLNWNREFGRHNVGLTGVWTRQETAFRLLDLRYTGLGIDPFMERTVPEVIYTALYGPVRKLLSVT